MTHLIEKGDIYGKYFTIVFDLKTWLIGIGVDSPLIYFQIGPFCIMYQWRKLVNVGDYDELE